MATQLRNVNDGGEAILQALRNLDIDYVMSSPGSEWGPVWEALARQQVDGRDGPTYLSCWHETLAVDLAIGYTAVTGRMQAVLLHAGAGLLQGSMGIHAAALTGTPMVIMSGEALSYGEDREFDPGRQWFTSLSVVGGPHRLVEPLVKFANQASSPSTLYEQVVRAGELAQRSPSGPTYLSVPIENMMHEWTPPAKMRKAPPAPKTRASDADIEAVAALVAAAKNPVISTESAGGSADGYAALLSLAEALSIPVVEGMVAGVCNFPKDHPLHLGFGPQPALKEADLVLVVKNRVPWYPPSDCPAVAKVVVIDDDPIKDQMVYQSLQADLYLEGDVPTTLRLLEAAVAGAGLDKSAAAERRARAAAAHDALWKANRAAEAASAGKGPIDPAWLCAELSRVLPDDTVYVDETTTHRRFVQSHLQHKGPLSYFSVPSGLGQGLGFGLGVKLANPDRPVVTVIGDGAFLYNPVVQSLGFAKQAKLPTLIVVFNNQGYNAMRNNQLSYYPEGTGKQHNLFLGHTIDAPEYSDLVAPFGGWGRRVEDPADLESAINEGMAAVAEGRTAILNVVIGR
ncbi:MAG: thiamine pyrophosphate-binding protein [Alphaproteobacteria bacterium]|nr:thiamine pyrophosphate-binding protein [Alphaproteobacteria bacterium]